MTPVEQTATWSSRTRAAIAAPPCMCAAASIPRPPVAALALPEFAAMARRPSSCVRSCVTSTGAASTPDRVKRAALTVSSGSQTSSPRSRAPDAFSPQATPEARKPAGSPAPGASATASGTSTQREEKNALMRSPRPRRGRT